MKKLMLFFFLSILQVLSFAQPNIKNDWQASWIGEANNSVPNTFYKYRYQFQLKKLPKIAKTSIAVDSKYWLYINEKLIVFEGQLKRGPTPNDTYYDELDIAPYLQHGKNTIALLVWYWGKDGFCHKSSGSAGLLFEADLQNQKIISSVDWKVAIHKAYQNATTHTPTKPEPNFRLPEFNIRYNAQLDNEDWIKNNYDDSQWQKAFVLGKADTQPWNNLWKRPIPFWKDMGLVFYENNLSIKNNDTVIKMKLPSNITITPYFKIQAPAGLLIDIRTDNYFGGNAPNVRTEYITKEGIQSFETPAYMNGHEVIYTFPVGTKVIELKYRETKYNTEHVGYFNSNEKFFNKLWKKSATTLNVNMRDGIQDSPDRERAQWWGDVAIVLEEIFYTCDDRGIEAIKKAISNLMEWQKKDSVLFSPIPAGNWDKELPAQMLAAIGKYGIGKYIHLSGDTAMMRYCYPHLKKYMALWQIGDDGFVIHRNGGWSWHDWGDKIDEPILDNTWYYMALETCNEMAAHLKLTSDVENYSKQMQSIKTNFEKYFWKGNYFASNNYKFTADDRANGLAVCAGLVSKEQWAKLKPTLDTTFYAGPYLEKYILESYFIMNNAKDGLKRMENRYKKMAESKLTTLWEGWEIGSNTYGGGTYNHGWTGGPLSLLSGYVAGIRPTNNGYSSYIIKPQMGSLKKIDCGTLTAKGFIKVAVEKKNNKIYMQVQTIPAQGIIAIPKLSKQKSILINGSKTQTNFVYKNEDEAYWYYTCNIAGTWKIVNE